MIVEGWNGVPFEEPYRQVRDMVRFLREAMAGEKMTGTYGRIQRPQLQAGDPPGASSRPS